MFKDLTAIVLAAGDSTRLWPLKDKLFVSFNGIPLIQYSLNQLTATGISNIIIVASKENQTDCNKLIEFNKSAQIKVITQKNNLGMAGAIIAAENYLTTEKILVVGPTDIVENILYSDFGSLYRKNPDGILVGKKLENYEPLGYYTVRNNNVADIVEKPGPDYIKSNIAAIVFDYFQSSKKLLAALGTLKSGKDDLYEQAKLKLINEGAVFKLLPYNGYWGKLKFPWHILSLNRYMLSKVSPGIKKAKIDESAKISGSVLIEDDVTILENVKIVGPAIISKGTLIGQNSLIRESVIGQNCVVGNSTEITRSYVGNNCWFHHNYIGDSVISDGVAFGFGSCTANYRLDSANIKSLVGREIIDTGKTKLGAIIGKNARLGVNSAVMPGIKIGKSAIVGSSVTLSKDLGDNKYIEIISKSFRIRENRVKNTSSGIEENRKVLKY